MMDNQFGNFNYVNNFNTALNELQRVPSNNYNNYNNYTEDIDNFFRPNYQSAMSTAGSFSPSSIESQTMDLDISYSNEQINDFGKNSSQYDCKLTILVQPLEKFRFRYKSEMMGTHGSLQGENEESAHRKEVPTAKLINCKYPKAVIRCTIVTADEDRRFPHAHRLVRKNGNDDTDDPHDLEVTNKSNYTAMFCNMGIIHTAKKNIQDEILRKKKIELIEEKKRNNAKSLTVTTTENLTMKMQAEKAQKWMNLNSVALCFQGFRYGENDVLWPITEKVYSRAINNLKSALTGELKICRIDKPYGSVEGNEEVWLLVEKVGKKNIKVKLREEDDNGKTLWEQEGRFTELDVHHQYAIVFKTPAYKDVNIDKPVEVLLRLERPSDGEISNSIRFVYRPMDKILNRKRPRFEFSSSSADFSNCVPTLENCAPMSETCMKFNKDDIINMSDEIKNLLANNDMPSEEYKDFLNNMSDIEQYFSTDPVPDNLVPDGIVRKSLENFPYETIKKIADIYQEIEAVGTNEVLIAKVISLLEETTNFGDTPLHSALRLNNYQCAERIIKIISLDTSFQKVVNALNSKKQSPLHLAVRQNQPEIVRALLMLGANPNLCDEDEKSPLHSAVEENSMECLDELLKKKEILNLDAQTENGWSALHLAAKIGSALAVKALIEAGANVNKADMCFGRTALHIAVDYNHQHIVRYLLTETQIDVNQKNFGGNVALHSAVARGGKCAEELVKILKKYGADPNIRNNTINDEGDNFINCLQDISNEPTIKSENDDSDDACPGTSQQGQSSFDLAHNDAKLMQLLSGEKPTNLMEEELDLKEEIEDEMSLQDRAFLQIKKTILGYKMKTGSLNTSETSLDSKSELSNEYPVISSKERQLKELEKIRQAEEKFTMAHVQRISKILDEHDAWIKIAQNTGCSSYVRLFKKNPNPTETLFKKIMLKEPDILVSKVKKLLIEANAYEAATALDTR